MLTVTLFSSHTQEKQESLRVKNLMQNVPEPINIPLLLISRTSWLHGGLQVLLSPLLKAGQIELAQDVEIAKNWAAAHPQGLWIIDIDSFPVDTLSSLKEGAENCFPVACVAITTTFEEYTKAAQQGVETVLLRGFSMEELTAAIYRVEKRINSQE